MRGIAWRRKRPERLLRPLALAGLRVAWLAPLGWGLGFRYELRNREAYVSAVYDYSPAARAGLKKGDRLMSIQGVDVATLDDEAVRSKVTVGARSKLVLQVLHPDRTPLALTIEPGPVYATWAEENPQAPQ